MIKAVSNPKKKGVNLTLTEDELEDLRQEAASRGSKPTSFATLLFRRAMSDLKSSPSLEYFLRPHITIAISGRFSADSQQNAATALALLFEDANTEAIAHVIELLERYAATPWTRAIRNELHNQKGR